MTDSREKSLVFARSNHKRFQEELFDLLKIPSISTDPGCVQNVRRAAEWIANHLQEIGIPMVEIIPTAGHPIVYGEWLGAGENALTVLIYGHYDVQPPEPLDLWLSGPFQPEIRGDNLYARGASDMKGQVLAVLDSVEAILKSVDMQVNLKFLIEGEEEIGSPHIENFLKDNRERLACSYALNPDTGMIAPDLPTITYGLRGLAYFEVRVFGPDHDLHSGSFGGVVHNPAQALCEIIAGMHDERGRVTLPGFYDRVVGLSKEERAELARLPMDEEFFKQQTGAPELWGEAGYSPVERVGARPTLEVNGLYSGYTEEGAKTVLPAWAMAKISARLVPNQDPDEVSAQLREFISQHTPPTVRTEIRDLVGNPASISARQSPGIVAMQRALEQSWGNPPVFRREGGSVPVVGMFQRILGVETINSGFSLQDDHAHGPNEKLHLPTWHRGIDSLIHFFYNLGERA